MCACTIKICTLTLNISQKPNSKKFCLCRQNVKFIEMEILFIEHVSSFSLVNIFEDIINRLSTSLLYTVLFGEVISLP